MSKKFYVVCDDNCRIPGMSKEQIYEVLSKNTPSARVENGCLYLELDGVPIPGDDSGFITTMKETNAGKGVSLWVGTEAEFNAIPAVEADSFLARVDANGKVYICTNDSLMALLKKTLHEDYITVGDTDLDEQMVDILNSNSYMAGSVKQATGADADYVGKPVTVCYQTANPPALSTGSQLAIWKDKGNGIAEIQPISLQAVKKWFDNFFHDGMQREFEADVNGATYTSEGTASKIYTVTCGAQDNDDRLVTFTVDYKTIAETTSATAKTFVACLPPILLDIDGMEVCELEVFKVSNGVKFKCYKRDASGGISAGGFYIKKICGYY